MKYIAYGSNMSIAQMRHRAPGARLVGTGRIEGARLEFYVHATVEKSKNPADTVPVAVWEITPSDKGRLDIYEGWPTYYVRRTCSVRMDDGSEIRGLIYIMNSHYAAEPSPSYYGGILNAYTDLGLSSQIETVLEPALRRSQARARSAG